MEDRMLIDPRHGDIEDDAASPGQRSLLAIAGSLLVEISLPKLLFAWTVSLLFRRCCLVWRRCWRPPGFQISERLAALTGIGAALALLAIVALGWIGWRPLFRIAESQFLVAQRTRRAARLCVRPRSAASSDGTDVGQESDPAGRARLRSANSVGAGIMLCACAALIAMLAWPASRWTGSWNDLVLLHRLVVPTLANAIVLVSGYLAVASLVWGIADASMQQPVDLAAFDTAPPEAAAGALRICRTFTWSANNMAFASKADGRARAAMGGSIGSWRTSRPFMRPIRSTTSSSAAI